MEWPESTVLVVAAVAACGGTRAPGAESNETTTETTTETTGESTGGEFACPGDAKYCFEEIPIDGSESPKVARPIDFDGDDVVELVLGEGGVGRDIGVLDLAAGNAVLIPAGEALQVPVPADLDGDGWLDILTSDANEDPIVIRNEAGVPGNTYSIPVGGAGLASAIDVNQDGVWEILTDDSNGQAVLWEFGNGWTVRPEAFPISGCDVLGLTTRGDFDGDGDLDLAHASAPTDWSAKEECTGAQHEVHVLLADADADALVLAASLPVSGTVQYLGAGDFDGDGKTDLVHGDGDTIWVFISAGSGSFGPPLEVASMPVGSFAVADLAADGVPELVVTIDSRITVLEDVGGDNTHYDVMLPDGRPVGAGDLDGDGRDDVLVTGPTRLLLSRV